MSDEWLIIITGNKARNGIISARAPPNPGDPSISRAPKILNGGQCIEASLSWMASSSPGFFATKTLTASETWIYETIQDVGDGSLYTACDGIPRFRFNSFPTAKITSTLTVEKKFIYTMQQYDPAAFNEMIKHPPPAPPACNWNNGDCREHFRDPEVDHINPFSDVLYAPMGIGALFCAKFCVMDSTNEVALIYWPPVLTSRDICAVN
jgi:hypothetical protein